MPMAIDVCSISFFILVQRPARPCPDCGSDQWWQLPGETWHCPACEPDMPPSATTLTLPCHKVEQPPVTARAGLRALFENACQGLSITPEQLRTELTGDDIPDRVSGALTPGALGLTAKTLALICDGPRSGRLAEICRRSRVMPRFQKGHSGSPVGKHKGVSDKHT
jgi:hypothetical protein